MRQKNPWAGYDTSRGRSGSHRAAELTPFEFHFSFRPISANGIQPCRRRSFPLPIELPCLLALQYSAAASQLLPPRTCGSRGGPL